MQDIGLSGTQVTDAGLVHLKGLTALRWIELSGSKVTPEGIERLRKSLPNAQVDDWNHMARRTPSRWGDSSN